VPVVPHRQAAIIGAIVSDLGGAIHQAENRTLNVCQTGFGGGHAAALFLGASPHVDIHIFSASMNLTSRASILGFLQTRHGQHRIKIHHGDPCETVPRLLSPVHSGEHAIRCDILHGSNPSCEKDNIHLVRNSPCGALLTSMATKSLHDPEVYFGTKSGWRNLKEHGCVRDITCFADTDTKPTMQFCLAISKRMCQVNNALRQDKCDGIIARLSKRIILGRVCPAYEVPVPDLKKRQKKTATKSANVTRNPQKQSQGLYN
jgi:hypothetical protein